MRTYVVAAVMVLSKQLTIKAESDEHMQAQLLTQLQGDGANGWNRQAFDQQAVQVTVAEVASEKSEKEWTATQLAC